MPTVLRGGPEEAAAQLINILKARGVLDENGNVLQEKGESVATPNAARDPKIKYSTGEPHMSNVLGL